MLDVSEDEQDDAFVGNALDRDDAKTKADAARKAKEEREKTLKKMMDEDEGQSASMLIDLNHHCDIALTISFR